MAVKLGLSAFCVASCWSAWAVAAPIESTASTVDGTPTQAITWTDASGEPRTVHVLTDNHRIVRYDYVVDGSQVSDVAVGDYGIGNFVNHGSCDAGAVVSWEGVEDYEAGPVLQGANHYIWRSTFRFFMCSNPDTAWRVTNEYLFVTGEDHFIQTATYDSSDLPESEPVGDDMRGPYNQTSWPGDGNISGFGWGSEYKFVSSGPIGDGDANVADSVAVDWDWSEPNTIAYVWEWCDPASGAAVDREYGIVQNQPYEEQDFGGGFYACDGCFPEAPPLSGTLLPAAWAMPSQLSSYDSNYRSGRITWGQTYGTFENGHSNDTGTIGDMGDQFRPINAWSWTHVVGKYSDGGVQARVLDTERAYQSRLVASVGTVVGEGPRGPGDYVGPEVGQMPQITWSNPGFDFVYRTWNLRAQEGSVQATLAVSGSLTRPVFVVHDFPEPGAAIEVDERQLEAGVDYHVSHDAPGAKLWITLVDALADGEHSIVISPSSDGSTTSTTGADPTTGGSAGAVLDSTGDTGGSASQVGSNGSGGARGGAGPSSAGGADGGAAATGGMPEGGSSASGQGDGGCSCEVLGGGRGSPVWLLLVAGVALLRRRST